MTLTGKRIRRIRKGLGMSQVAFAEVLNVSPEIVCIWEKEKGRPSRKNQAKILELSNRNKPVVDVVEKQSTSEIIQIAKPKHINLGERIKKVRTDLGLNQQEFAEKIETSIPSVCNWEKGKHHPSELFIGRIAALINVHPNELKYGLLEKFVFEFVGTEESSLFPKATVNERFAIVDILSKEESPFDVLTLCNVVRRYRSNNRTTSILEGYFTSMATA